MKADSISLSDEEHDQQELLNKESESLELKKIPSTLNENEYLEQENLLAHEIELSQNNHPTSLEFSEDKPKRASLLNIVIFNLFQIGVGAAFAYSTAIFLPQQVQEFSGEEQKSNYLAIVGFIVALLQMTAAPIAGFLSDHTNSRFGKRTPYIIAGTLVFAWTMVLRGIATQVLFMYSSQFAYIVKVILFVTNVFLACVGCMAFSVLMNAYLSQMPDLYPTEQMGLVTGINGLTTLLSAALGVGVFGLLNPILGSLWLCVIVSALMIIDLIIHIICIRDKKETHVTQEVEELKRMRQEEETVNTSTSGSDVSVSEEFMGGHHHQVTKKKSNLCVQIIKVVIGFLDPFKNYDFLWAFLTRFFFTLGVSLVQTFGLYYLEDKIKPNGFSLFGLDWVKTSEEALGIFMLVILISGLVASVVGGALSDKIGRKPVILVSGVIVSFGAFALAILTNYTLMLVFSLFVGTGIGSYYGVDLGLANDIIGQKDTAKSLALFHTAQTFPTVLASPLGGLLLLFGKKINDMEWIPIPFFGYNILCACAGILTLVSSILILMVKQSNVKKNQPNSTEMQHSQEEEKTN